MARSFDLSADYQDSVEEVLQAFTRTDYWQARLANSGVDESELELLRAGGESGDDGTIEIVTLQVIHSDKLPGLISQLHRGNLSIRRQENWDAVSEGTSKMTFTGSVAGAPVKVWGTGALTSAAESNGCRLTCELNIHVKIPLIGGKLEKFIGTQLVNLVMAEKEFTSAWITQSA